MRTLKKLTRNSESGFIMPFVVGFLVILTTIGVTLAQTSTQTFNNSLNFSYNQVAHIASKAAIDYAEEAYELNAAYTGTPEQDFHITDQYRSTIEVVVLYDQGSDAKRISATGKVYVRTANNGTADFTREIQSSIIRNGAVAGGPADYEPILWLDANQPDTLYQSTASTNTELVESRWGSGFADVVEEYGNQGRLNFGSSDLELTYGGYSQGQQDIGLRFRGVDVPQGTTISDAYIQFTTDETKRAGALNLLVEGVDTNNAPSWSGNRAVSNATKTSATVSWSPNNWNNVGESGEDERVEVTSIVQEILNRGGWNTGNAMAFSISYINGSGIRTAESGRYGGDPELIINWGTSSGGGEATANGDPVGEWLDRSADSNDAELEFGSDATLVTNQINGYNAVRFSSNTALRAGLSTTASANGITSFAVMLPRTAGAANSRIVTAMNTSENNDSNNNDSAILFQRYGTGSTLAHLYDGTYGPGLSGGIDNNWSVYSSRISNAYSERLLENGADNLSNLISGVNYDIDEIFIGGTRSGSVGSNYGDFDLAELIVYDKDLVCSEMQSVENFLGLKYGIAITDKNCP